MNEKTNPKLERILDKVVNLNQESIGGRRINSNRVRDITKIIVKNYEGKLSDDLESYFCHENKAVRGISTSAYAMITGDLKYVRACDTGGLGIILSTGGHNMVFKDKQLWEQS